MPEYICWLEPESAGPEDGRGVEGATGEAAARKFASDYLCEAGSGAQPETLAVWASTGNMRQRFFRLQEGSLMSDSKKLEMWRAKLVNAQRCLEGLLLEMPPRCGESLRDVYETYLAAIEATRVELALLNQRWAVHIEGPDVIIAAEDLFEARAKVTEINGYVARLQPKLGRVDDAPLVRAVVVPWHRDAAAHSVACSKPNRWDW